MLHLPDTDLKQTRFYREAFAEGEAKGKLALIFRLLRRRLGVVVGTACCLIGVSFLTEVMKYLPHLGFRFLRGSGVSPRSASIHARRGETPLPQQFAIPA